MEHLHENNGEIDYLHRKLYKKKLTAEKIIFDEAPQKVATL
jgi:hypothetical protein